jgi:hypothetical protein
MQSLEQNAYNLWKRMQSLKQDAVPGTGCRPWSRMLSLEQDAIHRRGPCLGTRCDPWKRMQSMQQDAAHG